MFLLTQQAFQTYRPVRSAISAEGCHVAGQQRMSVRRDRSRRAAFYRLVVVAESRGTITAFALAWAYALVYFGNPGQFWHFWQ